MDLSTIFNSGAFSNQNRTLPNGAGGYSIAGGTQPSTTPGPIFNKPPAGQPISPVQTPSKYINPATGSYFSPQEYANYITSKIPSKDTTGAIGSYAGNVVANPNATNLVQQATNLNNARNDIATGTTDPFKAGNQSGVAYSPSELKAIENAYAGIYDPALNDVFSRLKDQKTQADAKQKQADQIFQTNENIRQWRATTGTSPTYSGDGSNFSKTQINSGASNANMTISDFNNLDPDLKNFYINAPKGLDANGKAVPIYTTFENDLKDVTTGNKTVDQVTSDIMSSSMPEAVKHYFIDKMPAPPEQKQAWYHPR